MSGGHFGSDPAKASEPMGPMDPQGRRGHVGRPRALAMVAVLALTAAVVVAWTLMAGGGERLLVLAPGAAEVGEGDEVRVVGRLERTPAGPRLSATGVRPVRDGDEALAVGQVLAGAGGDGRVAVAGEVAERVDERAFVLQGD